MPEGGQRLLSRCGHDEGFGSHGVPGLDGSGVGTKGGSEGGCGIDVVVGTTEVVVGGVSQAVGLGPEPSRII